MAYVPNPDDPLTPSDAVAQGRSHAEIRSVKQKIIDNKTATDSSIAEANTALQTETENRTAADNSLDQSISAVNDSLSSHVGDNTNPHGTNKTQVGLSEIPNLVDTLYSAYYDPNNPDKINDYKLASADSIGKLAHFLQQAIKDAANDTFQAVHPVGCIIVSAEASFNPNFAEPFNFATWVEIEDRYLKGRTPGSDSVKNLVGAHLKKITTAQLPAHKHPAVVTDPGHVHVTGGTYSGRKVDGSTSSSTSTGRGTVNNTGARNSNNSTTGITVATENTGNGADFDVKPASYVVTFWRRTT